MTERLSQDEGIALNYWYRWQTVTGLLGDRIGPFATYEDAVAARNSRLRDEAAALEHGTGVAGVWTASGSLWRDDLDMYLGRYIIEQAGPERPGPAGPS